MVGTAVLLVGDDGDKAWARKVLQGGGHVVVRVSGWDAALNVLHTLRFDLIVADGDVTRSRLAALTNVMPARVPVVALASTTFDEQLSNLVSSGRLVQLVEPVDPEALLEAVDRLLAH